MDSAVHSFHEQTTRRMISIRRALDADFDDLCSLDETASQDSHRHYIRRALERHVCCVAPANGTIAGFAVLEDTFFDRGFLSRLFVRSTMRRRGYGTALLRYIETLSPTPTLFSSTNLSNGPMQALLQREQFVVSGIIYNLDPNDPELVYVKKLQ